MRYKYNLVIASDHAGYELKQTLVHYIQSMKLNILDCGTNSVDRVDYPDYAKKVMNLLLERVAPFGILICDTGIGMSIAANRSSDLRAALCTNTIMAEMARAHNDANILVLGAKITEPKLSIAILDKFLTTDFEGGRHITRIAKLSF